MVKLVTEILALLLVQTTVCRALKIDTANANVTVDEGSTTAGVTYYSATMDENNHVYEDGSETPLFKISDVTLVDGNTLAILSASFLKILTKVEDYYILNAKQSFDYEDSTQRSYSITIMDDSAITININFQINNIDDEPPTLTAPQCSLDETTTYDTSNSTCSCTVKDPDGWLASMTFKIDGNDYNTTFFMDYKEVPKEDDKSAEVYITTLTELLYNETTFYSFDILAQDEAGHSTSPNERVKALIYVNDLRNTPPVWTYYFSYEQITEKQPREFKVAAKDGDTGLNHDVYYKKIWEQEDEDYITIDSTTGAINVRGIDRDKNNITFYMFTLLAYVDNGEYSSSLNVSFYVKDIDDNPPLINYIITNDDDRIDFNESDEKKMNISFLERYDGSFNTTIFIEDRDTGENAQFNVELEDLEDSEVAYSEAFTIVPTAGYRSGEFSISVKNSILLDYEDPQWINFQFNVLSSGTLNSSKVDRMLVIGTLIDWNDEVPTFNTTEFTIKIKETAKKDDLITQIEATDKDAEDQGKLQYELIGSYATQTLRIESPDGKIFVNKENAFDYDTVNPIFVQIVATDLASHTGSATLTIQLKDVNNKPPTINITGIVSVKENQPIGTKLDVSITATDPDTDADLSAEIDWDQSRVTKNSQIRDMADEEIRKAAQFLDLTYKPVEGSTSIEIELTVNDKNPDETAPDFETFDTLYLVIKVTDNNTDKDYLGNQNTINTVMISIIDVNDNVPYFPEGDKSNRTIQDAAKSGTSAGSISAEDHDVGSNLTYQCEATEPAIYDWLQLDENTGAFTVKDGVNVTADIPKTYYFDYDCVVYDDNFTHMSDHLTVSFYIIDINNQFPVITVDDNMHVTEESDAGIKVSEIETSDEDRDLPFHTVECDFKESGTACAEKFVISDNTIYVQNGGADIDRDHGTVSFDCTIICRDNPKREQGEFTQNVVEASFVINLDDINDNTPQLINEGPIEVYENVMKNDEIVKIIAQDIDEGVNADINFKLSKVLNENNEDVTNLFQVVTNEDYLMNDTFKCAHLLANEDFKLYFGSYLVFIELSDRGEVPNTATYNITVEVNKFNFEQPRFVFPENGKSFILDSQQEPLTQLIQLNKEDKLPDFNASDNSESDECIRWDLQFEVLQLSPSDDNIFVAGTSESTCSFQLQVNTKYEESTALKNQIYELMLITIAKEGKPMAGEEPYTTNVTINIVFQNQTQEPIFNYTEINIKFLEEFENQTKSLEIPAYYPVPEEDQIGPFYFIDADNYTEQFFLVDLNDGTVSLASKLDYEIDKSFNFKIIASSKAFSHKNDPASTINVNVEVIDINDNPPVWTNNSYYGAIMPTYLTGYKVVLVEAIDADDIDKGKLVYTISSDFTATGEGLDSVPDKPFYIESQTGQVYLNFSVDSGMSGNFEFEVMVHDQPDGYTNIVHNATTPVMVYIITSSYIVEFKFQNTRNEIIANEEGMLEMVSETVKYTAYRRDLETKQEEAGTYTYANLFFINNSNSQAIGREEILKIVLNGNNFRTLQTGLNDTYELLLIAFPSSGSTPESLEPVLRAWLIGVSVVLGTLCVVLLITYILKTRQLNQRIDKLVNKRFGSQESGLNRMGASLPTANKHAIEGSNPVYSTNREEKDNNDLFDDNKDRDSVKSGDSDLIGIEDNPEFDYNFKDNNNVSTYM